MQGVSPTAAQLRLEFEASAGASRQTLIALSTATIGILAVIVVGWLAYLNSPQAMMESVAHQSLSIGRTIVSVVEENLGSNSTQGDRQSVIDQLATVWSHAELSGSLSISERHHRGVSSIRPVV